jgi:hypothetical protein
LDVEVLEALLNPFEGGGVGAEHPFEQRRQETGAVERSRVARPRDARSKILENDDRAIMSRDDPVLANDAFERVQLALIVFAWCVSGDVDVAAVVLEDRAIVRLRKAVPRLVVQTERLGHLVGTCLRPAIEVDPEQLRP